MIKKKDPSEMKTLPEGSIKSLKLLRQCHIMKRMVRIIMVDIVIIWIKFLFIFFFKKNLFLVKKRGSKQTLT